LINASYARRVLTALRPGTQVLDCVVDEVSQELDTLVLMLRYRSDPRQYVWNVALPDVDNDQGFDIGEFVIDLAVQFTEVYARAPRIPGAGGVLIMSESHWWAWDPASEDQVIDRAELRDLGNSYVREVAGGHSLEQLDGPSLSLLALVRSISVWDSAVQLGCLGIYGPHLDPKNVEIAELVRFDPRNERALRDAIRCGVLFAADHGYERVTCKFDFLKYEQLGFVPDSGGLVADTSLSVEVTPPGRE